MDPYTSLLLNITMSLSNFADYFFFFLADRKRAKQGANKAQIDRFFKKFCLPPSLSVFISAFQRRGEKQIITGGFSKTYEFTNSKPGIISKIWSHSFVDCLVLINCYTFGPGGSILGSSATLPKLQDSSSLGGLQLTLSHHTGSWIPHDRGSFGHLHTSKLLSKVF